MSTQLTSTEAAELITTEDDAPLPASVSYLPVIIVSAILLVAHLPMLLALGKDLWARAHYQFFPFVLLGAGFLLYERLTQLKSPLRMGNQVVCIIVIIMSGFLLVLSSLAGSGTLAALATLMTLAAVAYGVGGWALFKESLPSLVLLGLVIPPPFKLDLRLITEMQNWIAWANGKILDLFQVEHIIKGAVIQIPGKQLMVEEACSGIHSLFSTLAFTLFFTLWMRRGVIHSILLLVTAVYWVLLGNLLRVFVIAIADYSMRMDLASDPQHSALSIAIFFLILALVASTDRLLLFMSPWSARAIAAANQKVQQYSGSLLDMVPDLNKSWLAFMSVGAVFALIAVLQFWLVGSQITRELTRPNLALKEIGENGLPTRIVGSQRAGYRTETRDVNNINGEHSQMWNYILGGKHRCDISLDYTFTGWHDLTICYSNNGWTITKKRMAGDKQGEGGDAANPYMQVEMVKGHLGQHGFLLFALFDESGERLIPPSSQSQKLLKERLDVIINNFSGKSVNKMTAPTYQVQLFVPTFGELSDSEKALATQLFRDVENRLKRLVAENKIDPSQEGAEEAEPSLTDAAEEEA